MQEQLLVHRVEEGNKAVRNAMLHAKEAQESGNENYLHFVDKLVLISGGALSASFTIFLALRDKQGVDDASPVFLFVWVGFLLAIACGLLLRIFLAYSHFVQAAIFQGEAQVAKKETILGAKGQPIFHTDGPWEEDDFEKLTVSLDSMQLQLVTRRKQKNLFVYFYKGFFWGSLIAFFSGISGTAAIGFLIVYSS